MFCWGNSTNHELCIESTRNLDLVIKPTFSNWKEAGHIKSISTGEFHCLYLTTQGKLYSCGNNDSGQLGRTNETPEEKYTVAPVETFTGCVITAIACGLHHSMALDEWGQPFSWGSDSMGQLGKNVGEQDKPKTVKRIATKNIVQIACGSYHTLALAGNGDLYAWGLNKFGQCATKEDSDIEPLPYKIESLKGLPIAMIACGGDHCIILTKSGAVYGWGKNTHGQLGVHDTECKSKPTELNTLRNVKVSYIDCGEDFSAFLTMDGGVFTCGSGEYGQTGHGNKKNELVPRKITELMGSTVTQIACGRRHLLCRVGNRILACGYGARGQLGCPHMSFALLPTPIPFGSTDESPTVSRQEEKPKKKHKKNENVGESDKNCNAGTSQNNTVSPQEKKPKKKHKNNDNVGESDKNSKAGTSQNNNITEFFNNPMKLFADGDHSFLVQVRDNAIPVDDRIIDQTKQIEAITVANLAPCQAFRDSDPADLDLMAYVETVFASLAVINSSYLLPNHYGCSDKIHGVDLSKYEEIFTIISRLECIRFRELIFFHLTNVAVRQILPNPVDVECLRIFLILPLYHEMRNPRRYERLQGPFAKGYNNLTPEYAQTVCAWWEAQSAEYFEILVDIFKSVVFYQIKQLHVPNTKAKMFNEGIEHILNLLKTLNYLNITIKKIPIESFYIDHLISYYDVTRDYIGWLNDQEGTQNYLCNYAFLFDVQCKSLLLNIDQQVQMHMAVSQATNEMITRIVMFPDSFMLEPTQFLHITVSRDHLVRDTINQISSHDSSQLKKPLKVEFVGEEAEDAGGVTKEFFLLLLKELFDPLYGMFRQSDETNILWFSNCSVEEDVMFYLVGAIFGLAIYNSIIIYVPFPVVLYKKLLNENVALDDLAEISPTLASNLKQLLEYTDEDVEEVFGLCFAVNTEVFGQVKTNCLKENGDQILVTHENKEEYVRLYVDFLLNSSVENQFKAFNEGFQKVCGGRIIKLFRSHELMSVVIGNQHYDWDVFEANAVYKNGYHSYDPQIKWFWEVFHHELDLEDKKRFLLFLTGSDRVPVRGMRDIKIQIQPVFDDRYFPVAHTCFNLLDLPIYKTKEKLKYYLLQAIQQTQGFSLV